MRNKITLTVIIVLELIAMLAVYPGGLIRRETMYSSGGSHAYAYTYPLEKGDECVQTFTAMGDRIKEHSFAIKPATPLSNDWKVVYEFLSPSGEIMATESFTGAEIVENGMETVSLNLKLKKGEVYSYVLRVESGEGGAGVTCTPYGEDFVQGAVSLYAIGELIPMQSFSQFVYMQKLNIKNVLFTWIFLWIIGGVILELVRKK